MSKIVDDVERPYCFGVNYDFISRKSDPQHSECCLCPHGFKCRRKQEKLGGEKGGENG